MNKNTIPGRIISKGEEVLDGVEEKVEKVKNEGLAGLNQWELEQDTDGSHKPEELIREVKSKIG